jgi:hypothetical protein
MSKALLERRLTEVGDELRLLRRDLSVADEQLAQLADNAEEARIRSLVSETPLAEREHRDAQRHAEAMERHRRDVAASIERLERVQDDLLDRLVAELG